MSPAIPELFREMRGELQAYLCRLVVRPQVAEELLQTAFLRALESEHSLPASHDGLRAWLFRVATNLAIDELRRHSTWRETMIGDLRMAAEQNASILAQSASMISTPETREVAREHLVACLACTLRNLPELTAAALLLIEVHGFSIGAAANILDCAPAQLKNGLQTARAKMRAQYGATCALIAKNGVCYQCHELNGYFATGQPSPLSTSADHVAERLRVARELRVRPWGTWHRLVFSLIDDLAGP